MQKLLGPILALVVTIAVNVPGMPTSTKLKTVSGTVSRPAYGLTFAVPTGYTATELKLPDDEAEGSHRRGIEFEIYLKHLTQVRVIAEENVNHWTSADSVLKAREEAVLNDPQGHGSGFVLDGSAPASLNGLEATSYRFHWRTAVDWQFEAILIAALRPEPDPFKLPMIYSVEIVGFHEGVTAGEPVYNAVINSVHAAGRSK